MHLGPEASAFRATGMETDSDNIRHEGRCFLGPPRNLGEQAPLRYGFECTGRQ
jgi:hypothetical protein